jgi:hypothetical protein
VKGENSCCITFSCLSQRNILQLLFFCFVESISKFNFSLSFSISKLTLVLISLHFFLIPSNFSLHESEGT